MEEAFFTGNFVNQPVPLFRFLNLAILGHAKSVSTSRLLLFADLKVLIHCRIPFEAFRAKSKAFTTQSTKLQGRKLLTEEPRCSIVWWARVDCMARIIQLFS